MSRTDPVLTPPLQMARLAEEAEDKARQAAAARDALARQTGIQLPASPALDQLMGEPWLGWWLGFGQLCGGAGAGAGWWGSGLAVCGGGGCCRAAVAAGLVAAGAARHAAHASDRGLGVLRAAGGLMQPAATLSSLFGGRKAAASATAGVGQQDLEELYVEEQQRPPSPTQRPPSPTRRSPSPQRPPSPGFGGLLGRLAPRQQEATERVDAEVRGWRVCGWTGLGWTCACLVPAGQGLLLLPQRAGHSHADRVLVSYSHPVPGSRPRACCACLPRSLASLPRHRPNPSAWLPPQVVEVEDSSATRAPCGLFGGAAGGLFGGAAAGALTHEAPSSGGGLFGGLFGGRALTPPQPQHAAQQGGGAAAGPQPRKEQEDAAVASAAAAAAEAAALLERARLQEEDAQRRRQEAEAALAAERARQVRLGRALDAGARPLCSASSAGGLRLEGVQWN